MNELQFARQIKERLDEGLALQPEMLERLRAARERALAKRSALESVSDSITIGRTAARTGGGAHIFTRVVLPALLIAAALFGFNAWQQARHEALLAVDPQAAEIAEIDSAVLKSDLPIDAYLDKGFQAWFQELAGSDEDSQPSQ